MTEGYELAIYTCIVKLARSIKRLRGRSFATDEIDVNYKDNLTDAKLSPCVQGKRRISALPKARSGWGVLVNFNRAVVTYP